VGLAVCDEIQTAFGAPRSSTIAPSGFSRLVVLARHDCGFHPHSASPEEPPRCAGPIRRHQHHAPRHSVHVASPPSSSLTLKPRPSARRPTASSRAFQRLVREFPEWLQAAQGVASRRLKFHRVEDAIAFHRRAVAAGLWCRAHAYHAGHSTVLTKLGCSPAPKPWTTFSTSSPGC